MRSRAVLSLRPASRLLLCSRAAMSSASSAASGAPACHFLAPRLAPFGAPTVWQEFTPLASPPPAGLGAVNCGQGFPDWPAPAFVKDALCAAVQADANQYTRSAGHPGLCRVLAARYGPLLGRGGPLDWENEVAVGVGSSETLYACMQALVAPGDEVVLISPAFDIYSAQNPTGKVFSRAELEQIADIVAGFPRVVVLSDEVYENMLYDGREHVRMATLPGMWERTLTVSSAGKTFSVTGWKIGWALGPAALVRGVIVTNQWVQFSVSTPAQQAIADCFTRAAQPYEGFVDYYAWLADRYARKRAVLAAGLAAAGLPPVATQGSFFIMADTTGVAIPAAYTDRAPSPACGTVQRRDWAFCTFLAHEIGVIAIPTSAFYEEKDKHLADGVARFAFCKEDASLEDACRRLLKLRAFLKPAPAPAALSSA